ncbi:MAG: TonB-dependent receptor, partial [Kofleriaceae bacterium]|nr:TonB-dependent receptor [Kofleriaceae bacterium]
DQSVRGDIENAMRDIADKVAVLEVQSTPPGAQVYLNRKDLGAIARTPARIGLAAGTYIVIVEAEGYELTQSRPIEVRLGSRVPVSLDLKRVVGSVAIKAEPGTQVRVDDEGGPVACIAPCTLQLPPGQRLLFFTKEGFATTPRTVRVEPNKAQTVNVTLSALTGSLLVATEELNALVEVDGRAMGFAPTVINNVQIGTRRVRVSLRGYQSVERTVDIKANQQSQLDDIILEPIRQVSAASRTAESIDDAPASVSIISGPELESFAYPTIMEALRGTRGVAINYDSIYGNAAVRGLGQANDYNNRLLVLSDGAILNENILYQPFIHYDGRTDLGDVDRIEVVRGPGSVLYGTGAVSGVVNLVLRDPKDEPSSHVQVSSYENGVARFRVGLAQKFGRDGAVSVAAAGSRNGGRDVTIDAEDGNGGTVPTGLQQYDRYWGGSVVAHGNYKILSGQVFYTGRRNIMTTGAFGATLNDPRNYGDDRRFLAELKAEPKIGKNAQLLLRGLVNGAYYHLDYIYETGDPAFPRQNYTETYKSRWYGAEARLATQLGKMAKLQAGAELQLHTEADMKSGQFEADGSFTDLLDVLGKYNVYSAYALADVTPSPKVRVQVGARLDRWDTNQTQTSTSGAALAKDFTAVSPRAAVIVKPTEKDIVKLMGGRAYRAPSMYEFFYTDFGVSQVESDCCGGAPEQEKVYSIESEYLHRYNRDWSLLVAGYANVAQNIIESIPVPQAIVDAHNMDPANVNDQWAEGVLYYRNSPVDQRMFGADLEIKREFRANTMLAAYYGFLHGRYAGSPDEADPDASRELPNAPTHYAGVKATGPIIPNQLVAGVRATLEDARRIDLGSEDKTKRAVIADIVLSGTSSRLGLRYALGMYNVFDWKLSLPASPYASRTMPQAGRSVIFSVTYAR